MSDEQDRISRIMESRTKPANAEKPPDFNKILGGVVVFVIDLLIVGTVYYCFFVR